MVNVLPPRPPLTMPKVMRRPVGWLRSLPKHESTDAHKRPGEKRYTWQQYREKRRAEKSSDKVRGPTNQPAPPINHQLSTSQPAGTTRHQPHGTATQATAAADSDADGTANRGGGSSWEARERSTQGASTALIWAQQLTHEAELLKHHQELIAAQLEANERAKHLAHKTHKVATS